MHLDPTPEQPIFATLLWHQHAPLRREPKSRDQSTFVRQSRTVRHFSAVGVALVQPLNLKYLGNIREWLRKPAFLLWNEN
jgi:hypothetical protein